MAGPPPEPPLPAPPSEPQPGESSIDADFRAAGEFPKQKLSDEGLERWNADLDRQAAYREEVDRERIKALKEGGMRIEERSIEDWSKPREE